LALKCSTTSAVEYALENAPTDVEETMTRRKVVAEAVAQLAELLDDENKSLIKNCDKSVGKVLNAGVMKHVALMRELAVACRTEDIASPALLLIGIPMLGWAPPAHGLLARVSPPEMSMEEWTASRHNRNDTVLRMARASGDHALDEEAYGKSVVERDLGVLDGPFTDIESAPLDDIGLVPRQGIWEAHGDAVVPTVRCIDNMLAGEQNATAGTLSAHQPTDPDALVAQVGAVREKYPGMRLLGWPSDYKKAYKQVPNEPCQRRHCVIAQWSPAEARTVFWVPSCQLFGGKSPPLNFARYPAWMCWLAAVLYAIPASHCVDDVISVEPERLALQSQPL